MNFKPIKKLNVTRTLSTGVQVLMGTLAQNHNGVFFSIRCSLFNTIWQ
ncbi:Uncharacterised protein [Proteus mirabilis]|uniref:Uncharacterized protein n=1 Tax=Proteus mirabilis TaxID=584 RepID=A0A2X2C014_PROMI|nr:Uncharacterised protein [Proteus mirabilis]